MVLEVEKSKIKGPHLMRAFFSLFFHFFFFLEVLSFELGGLTLARQAPYPLSHASRSVGCLLSASWHGGGVALLRQREKSEWIHSFIKNPSLQ
jgi:hypothetical protein